MGDVIRLQRPSNQDPMEHPTLVGDYLREPGQSFAQAWKAHIESCLNPDILGTDAENPAIRVVY